MLDLALHQCSLADRACQIEQHSQDFVGSPCPLASQHPEHYLSPKIIETTIIITCQASFTDGYAKHGTVIQLTMFLTHLLACPCGSMKRGHLLENCTITPFSMDSVSLGRPAICQFLILTGSPRIEIRLEPDVWGTLNFVKAFCQDSTNSILYSP